MELNIEQALQQGIAAHNEGKLQDAERLYRAILQSQPLHPDANHNLGVIAASVNKVDAALQLFKTAIEANPKIEKFWLSYIHALIKEQQLENAMQALEQAKEQGVSAEKLNVLGTQLASTTQENPRADNPSQKQLSSLFQYYQKGRFNDAEKLATFITNEFPKHQFAWKVLGAVFRATGRKFDAADAYRTVIALAPKDADGHYNLGIILQELGKLNEAEIIYTQAIALKSDLVNAHFNLGTVLQELGRIDEAGASYRKAIASKSDFAEAHSNLGSALRNQGKLDEAKESLQQAIALKPDYAEAHSNLGSTLQELGRLDEAEKSLQQAIALKPDYAEAHNNLGAVLKGLVRLDEAVASYAQAIALKPDYAEAHFNLANTLKDLGRLDKAEESLQQAVASKPDFALAYKHLGITLEELGRLDEAKNIYQLMLTKRSEHVSSATVSPVVALLPFGRSGSLFFHSLFDGHPDISTLPGLYFKGWFGLDQWRRFAPDLTKLDWREHLIEMIVKEYQPFFNASCKNNVPGEPLGKSEWLAQSQGFTNMGPDRSHTFIVDQKSFSDTFLLLLKSFSSVGIQECFELIHRAFDISARRKAGKNSQTSSSIFYHIHNPDGYEYAHFLKHYPQARSLHIIRNPVQSMESWLICEHFNLDEGGEAEKDRRQAQLICRWIRMVNKIVKMFVQLQSPFNVQAHSRGVRLEDVKRNTHDVMPKIAAWMGLPDNSAIYESSFCGFQYWGPSSKGTGTITGFDTAAIDLPTGRLLGNRDILIFETLFFPFSYQYGYTQLETSEFHSQLMVIRPWLAEPLEFERQLYHELFDHSCALEELPMYIRLHNLLSWLWETLYRDGTYHNMVKPMELAE